MKSEYIKRLNRLGNDYPCPFCKGTNVDVGSSHTSHFVFCIQCSASGPYRPTYDDAINAWKNRHEPDTLPHWAIEAINEMLSPGSCPANHETRIIMDTLKWVLSIKNLEERE